MTKCKRFTKKDKQEIRSWAKKNGAVFTVKDYNKMLKRVVGVC